MLAKHIFLILLIKIKSCQEHKKYSIFSLKKIKEREELFLAFESPFWTYQKKKVLFESKSFAKMTKHWDIMQFYTQSEIWCFSLKIHIFKVKL